MIISTTARVDLIRICKYASPEPSASVGSEETPNSSLASPTSPTQLKNDESTVISNQGYTNETNVKLKASATDSDNPEVITLFFEAALNSGAFSSPATPTTGGSCASGTEWSFCGDKIWYVTSASGDSNYSTASAKYTLANIPSSLNLTADSSNQITASWNANSNPANTEYYIENTTTGTNSGWITSTSWVSSDLTCATSYSFQVKARNGDNTETSYTGSASVETNGCGGGGMPPGTSNPPSQPELTPENPESGFSVSINNGDEYTSSEIVTLKLNAGADTTKMAISNTEDFEYASQIDYQEEIEWELLENPPSPLLQKGNICTVYAKFYTQYGVASEMVSDSIILDTQAPEEVKNLLEMLISKICK